MINFHPSERLLSGFANASLSAGMNLAIAAHLDFCPLCRASVAQYEAEHAHQCWSTHDSEHEIDSDADSLILPNDLDSILHHILEKEFDDKLNLKTRQDKAIEATESGFIKINHQRFRLPRVLRHQFSTDNKWRKMSGIHSSPLGEFDEFKANLIFIEPNTQVPSHTHKGLEVTVVLSGSLVDEQGRYSVGDFIVLDNNLEHSPITRMDESCLCLTVMDAPLQFTKGISRLLNPFAQLLY